MYKPTNIHLRQWPLLLVILQGPHIDSGVGHKYGGILMQWFYSSYLLILLHKRGLFSFYSTKNGNEYQQIPFQCYGWVVKHKSLVWKVSIWNSGVVVCCCKLITSLWTRHNCTLPRFSSDLVTIVQNPLQLVEICPN